MLPNKPQLWPHPLLAAEADGVSLDKCKKIG
jgi:hypothetical protein